MMTGPTPIFVFLLLLFVTFVSAEIYFEEEFNDGWENRWVMSKFKGAEAGEVEVSTGKYFNDPEHDKGLRTKQDAKFYQVSAEMKEFSNKGKTLVVQFSVKHEQNIDCGGGYVKLLPAGIDQEQFNGDSNYNIMFGPDVCGSSKRTHFILTYKGKNNLIKKDIRCESDEFTHLYTMILNSDQTFKVLIDNKEVRSGNIVDEWDILPPKEILDPKVSKPSDWVDEKEIPDPTAVKPEGWDNIPAKIPDSAATKPDDWDDELDGEWEAPLIDNPEYKGEWKAPMIPNPEYKGTWVHPKISNPDYYEDAEIYAFESFKYIGIEIWQVKSGTIFDHFLVTDNVEEATTRAETILKQTEAEKAAAQKEKDLKKDQTPEVPLEDSIGDENDFAADLEEDEEKDVHDEL